MGKLKSGNTSSIAPSSDVEIEQKFIVASRKETRIKIHSVEITDNTINVNFLKSLPLFFN